jgi:uncharacterized membrane protein
MPYTFLKFASYGFAWIGPIVILLGTARWMSSRSITTWKRRIILAILIPLLWVAGLIASFTGLRFHQSIWFAEHPKGIVTEDDMVALGDYPNVFAGWILVGWLPIAAGLFLSNRLIRNQQKHKSAHPTSGNVSD